MGEEKTKLPEEKFSGNNYEVEKILLPTKGIPLIVNGKEWRLSSVIN